MEFRVEGLGCRVQAGSLGSGVQGLIGAYRLPYVPSSRVHSDDLAKLSETSNSGCKVCWILEDFRVTKRKVATVLALLDVLLTVRQSSPCLLAASFSAVHALHPSLI